MPSGQNVAALSRAMAQPRRPLDLNRLLDETVRTLSNIDLEHGFEMEKLERSRASTELKRQIAESLRSRHHERREPYLRVIADIRQRMMAMSLLNGLQAAS